MPADDRAVHSIRLPDGHEISDARARLDMAYVCASLATTYWAHDRPAAQIRRSWDHCLGIGVYAPGGGMAGFSRILTDYTLRAHIGDVFIDPAARGSGLGKALVSAVLDHPALASVEKWTLTTGDAHGLYTRHGFRLGEADGRWMTLDRTGDRTLDRTGGRPLGQTAA